MRNERENKKIYNSKAWKDLRKAKLADCPVCEYCGRNEAKEIDHVKAIEDGGDPFDWDNLKSACKSCHSIKTNNIEILKRDHIRIRGCEVNGDPVDPSHWWNNGTSRSEF